MVHKVPNLHRGGGGQWMLGKFHKFYTSCLSDLDAGLATDSPETAHRRSVSALADSARHFLPEFALRRFLSSGSF